MFTNHKLVAFLGIFSFLVVLTSVPASAMAAAISHNYSDWKVLPSGGQHFWWYNCFNGQKVVSGGFDSIFNNTYGTGLRLVESYAHSSLQWRWSFINEGPKPAQYRLQWTCYTP